MPYADPGMIAPERLGTGTPTGSTILLGNSTWATGAPPDTHVATHHSGGSDALVLSSIAGTITAGQHGSPAGDLHPSYALDADLAAHEAAADPHTGYQRETEKAAASGYASLDAATKVPIAQVPTGTTASTVCIGNDARLSDARTPTAHVASHQNGGTDEIGVTGLNGLLADAQYPLIGAEWYMAVAGNDARLTNARTPTAHTTTHRHGGSDEVATATAGANLIPKAGAGGTLAIGWIPTGTTSSTACIGDDARLSDARTPTTHDITSAHNGFPGGSANFLRADGTWAAPAVAAPFTGNQATGSFTLADGQFGLHGKRLTLITTERATLAGSSRLAIAA